VDALLEIVACSNVPAIQECDRATIFDALCDLLGNPYIVASVRYEYKITRYPSLALDLRFAIASRPSPKRAIELGWFSYQLTHRLYGAEYAHTDGAYQYLVKSRLSCARNPFWNVRRVTPSANPPCSSVENYNTLLLAFTASASTYTSLPMSRNFFDISAMPASLSFSVAA
jgi:hypothetical protein